MENATGNAASVGAARSRGSERPGSGARRRKTLLERLSAYLRLTRLDRPIGTWLLLWPTLWALWIAGEGRPAEWVFLVLVLGTIIVRSAGCVINDFADRNIDPYVRRTRERPLASGEVTPAEALLLFGVLMLAALALVMTLNRLTVMLAVVGAALAIVYPFTKRFFSAPQLVLGVAFAWGVPMAFAAQLGEVTGLGWLVFAAALLWVVAYDTQYAMVDRDDDVTIGVRSTAILFRRMDRLFVGLLQLAFLLILLFIGQAAELGLWFYGGVGMAGILALHQQLLIRDRRPEQCFQAFLNNAWLGGFVFAGILLDYVFR